MSKSLSPTPVIGVTTGRSQNTRGLPIISLTEAYVQAVSTAGAIPVLIPLGLPEAQMAGLLARLDGLVLSGGGDVQPERYGGQPHPLVDSVDPDRDRVEIWLLQRTLEARLPFLGICRGLQVVNVALGGSLYEDVLDQRPGALRHQRYPEQPRNYLAHSVRVDPASRLFTILGQAEPPVNSLHHQGIRDLAPGLRASAHAPDGLVEACELPDYPFGLAVQWHPEWLTADAAMRALFAALAQAGARAKDEPHE